MKNTKPVITALMTTYNSALHVKETIDSILEQTYKNFTFLILDDGSTDNTVAIIKSYQDKRIKLIEKKGNKGIGYRLRQTVELVDTLYIAKVDSDDISHKDRFLTQLTYMQENPNLDIIKSLFSYFPDTPEVEASERYQQYKAVKEKEHNAINTPKLIAKELPRWSCFAHTTYFAKSKIIKIIQYPDTRYGEDYYLFLTALNKGYKLGCLQKVLVNFRVSDYSVTKNKNTAYLYAQTLTKLKHQLIKNLHMKNKEIYIYGTGGLGIATYKVLKSQGYNITHLIDRETKEPIEVNGCLVPVKSINEKIKKSIVIAAQPVRNEVSKLLEAKGLVEWENYLIIA